MIENCVIYLVFRILNECICIETKKVTYTKYLISSMCFSIQYYFFGTWYFFN
jgi:hypothetical protein